MARILHIDTSAAKSIVLLGENGEPVASRIHDGERDGAAVINRLVSEALQDAGWLINTLDAVAVCTGPGSYTGLRIALATAKGLAYALDIPLIAHDRLTLGLSFALSAYPENDVFLAVLRARAGEYFIAARTHKATLVPPCLMTSAQLDNFLQPYTRNSTTVWGGPAETITAFPENSPVDFLSDVYPDAATWLREAHAAFGNHLFADAASLEPAYLKEVFIQSPAQK